MSRIRSRDTSPELQVRRLLHSMGYRYRLHARELPGTPDVVFRKRKKAIFVHGCYWHGHGCSRGGSGAKSNQSYWGPKIAKNKARDETSIAQLRDTGWTVLVIWECGLTDRVALAELLDNFLSSPRA